MDYTRERTAEKRQGMDKRSVSYFDYSLLFLIVFICVVGLIMIYSASAYYVQSRHLPADFMLMKQLKAVLLGLVVMLCTSLFDYHIVKKRVLKTVTVSTLVLMLAYLLQIVATFFGQSQNGSSRWLNLGPLSFQPSEFSKLAIIVYISTRISYRPMGLRKFKGFMIEALPIAPLLLIIAKENLSTAVIAALIFVTICFVNSPRYFYFIASGVVVAGALVIYLASGGGYRSERVDIWLNVETHPKGQQILQGLYAITSGGLFGTGLGQSAQKYARVPEAYNDMIFTIICEELGLVGAIAIILVYMLIILRLVTIAANAADVLGSMITIGVMAQIAFQVVLNILVVTNTIPSTGVALPFVSYGGSSVLILLFEIGLVLNVSKQIKYRVNSGKQNDGIDQTT